MYSTKNYMTDNGDALVIGGKLEIKEGAEVIGMASVEGGLAGNAVEVTALAADADISAVVEKINEIIAQLKVRGVVR